jgi:PST family polysaccharide transporter
LREEASRGVVWTGGQALFGRLLSLLSFVVLARLLTPQDYGLAALAMVFIALLTMLAAAGFSQALVQQHEVDQLDLDTIFWIGLGISLVLALLTVGAAWPIAAAFDEPKLRPVLQVLSITLVFVALGSTHQAVLQRRLEFKTIASTNLVANTLATAVGVGFAFLGLGVWSLVVQTVLTVSLTTIGLMFRSGYRPEPQASYARFRPLFEFSRNSLGSTVTVWLNTRTDDFLVGSVLGARTLGIYSVAYKVLQVLVEVLTLSIRMVAFPTFSRIQNDRPRLLRAYRAATGMCATVAMPVFLFSLGAAPEIVRVVFGAKWEESVPVMQILCVFGIQHVVATFCSALLSGVGRARAVFRIELAGTILQIAAFAIAVPYGIEWVAVSFVIRAYVMLPFSLRLTVRELNTDVWHVLSTTVAPLVSALAMLGAIVLIRDVALDGVSDAIALAVLIAAGAASYLAALRLTDRAALQDLREFVTTALRRAPAVGGSGA